MTIAPSRHGSLALLLVLAAALPACQSQNRTAARGGGVRATDGAVTPGVRPTADDAGANAGGSRSGSGSEVSLTAEDLAPVDAYLKRRVWYVGDDVDVTASQEYFWQYVSFVSAKGVTDRHDAEDASGLTVTVTYLGPKESISQETAPRILIGTGITVSARHRLIVHFKKTQSADVPVKLQILVSGVASMGRGSDIVKSKEQQIIVGCALSRRPDGRYAYLEQ